MTLLCIGGVELRVTGAEAAVRARFGAFSVSSVTSSAIEIVVEADLLRLESEVHPLPLTVEGGRLQLPGGWYSPGERRGELRGIADLGPVDAMVRLALSLALPEEGALLLHGAALAERGLVLVGESGSGKSTAAQALGADCDELTIVRAGRLYSTPWWRGRAAEAPLSAIVQLVRGQEGLRRLSGGEALRMLLAQTVRYLDQPELFAVAASVVGQVAVYQASCPVGEAFVPSLRAQLQEVA